MSILHTCLCKFSNNQDKSASIKDSNKIRNILYCKLRPNFPLGFSLNHKELMVLCRCVVGR